MATRIVWFSAGPPGRKDHNPIFLCPPSLQGGPPPPVSADRGARKGGIFMMISTKGRYALRVMLDLADHDSGEYIPLKDIAQRQEISVKYLENILASLSRAGLVSAIRGKGGGYRLCRPAQDYSAGEIIRVAEGDLAMVSCLKGTQNGCGKAAHCRALPLWQGLDRVVDDYLDSVSLAQLQTMDGDL